MALNTLNSISELLEKLKETSTMLWFRGHRCASWDLLPSVFRVDQHSILESQMAHRFKLKAPLFYDECPQQTEYQKWLPLMQHYGLPTRLLDWSESPLVALFFAVECIDTEGNAAIFALNPGGMNEALHNSCQQPIIGESSNKLIIETCRRAFDIYDQSQETIDPIAVVSLHSNYRMLNQMACFTLHDNDKPLEESEYLDKWIIPQESLKGIREELTILGIRRSNLFPDLENLANELSQLVCINEAAD